MKTNKQVLPNQWGVFCSLTKRHLMVFFKNIPTVLFTLMVPLAVLAVYALFLRPMETDQIKSILNQYHISYSETDPEGLAFLRKIYGIADCWMISGVMAVSCITVSLNTNYILVRDKESGMTRDIISSPIDHRTITLSYFSFNAIVTFLINLIVYLICLLWLACYNAYMISLTDFFAIIGVLILSTISASLLTFFVCSFINTESVLSPVVAIMSAAVGFLIGAYLPNSMMPEGVQMLTTFFPGTYSAGLFRNYFMTHPIERLLQDPRVSGNTDFINALTSQFSLNINFFGNDVPPSIMALVIFAFSGIFLILNLAFASRNFIKVGHNSKKKRKKADKIVKGEE